MHCQLSEYYHTGEVHATKITKFGYHWDINESLEIDTAKNLTGIKVIGPNRTERTLDLAGMKKLMLEALEAKVQLERSPFFSTNHHSSSGI